MKKVLPSALRHAAWVAFVCVGFFTTKAQFQGQLYFPQNNEFLQGHGLGFMPNLKEGAVNVVDANQDVVALHGVLDPNVPNRYLHVMQTDPFSGWWNWSFVFDLPGQDLDPGGICEEPGYGYGVVGYDYVNQRSYVFHLDYGGNLMWTVEIPNFVGKNVIGVAQGVTGDPEFIVTGEWGGNDLYVAHIDINSGTPVYEYVQTNMVASQQNIGYCANESLQSIGYYRNVSTNGFNTFYINAYDNQANYQFSVENVVGGASNVNPLWLNESPNPNGNLITCGTVSTNGGTTHHAWLGYMNDHGELLWNTYLPNIPGSAYEAALELSNNGDIYVSGYVTNSNGTRSSIAAIYDIFGNLLQFNVYYPFFSNDDDVFTGIAELPAISGLVANGFTSDPTVLPGGLATRFTMDFGLNTDCVDPTLPPTAFLGVWWQHINNPPNQLAVANNVGLTASKFNLEVIRCGWSKRQPGSAAAAIDESVELRVFPQPAQQQLHIEIAGEDLQSYRLLSLDGKVLIENAGNGLGTEATLDVEQFPAGFYLLEVAGETQNWQQKVVVQ